MTKAKDKNVLSPSSEKELGALNNKFTVVEAMRARIGSVIDQLGLGGKSKAIVSAAVLSLVFGLSDVQAQSSQDQIDKKKTEVLNQQKALFMDAVTFLNRPETHNWVYTERQKGNTTRDLSRLSSGDQTLQNLLERNEDKLSHDEVVLLKKQKKKFLLDTISSYVIEDVLILVELQSEWYKDKSSINKDTKDMEQFPILDKHTFAINKGDLFLSTLSGEAKKKDYKEVIKKLSDDNGVKKSAIRGVIDANKEILPQSTKNPSSGNKIAKNKLSTVINSLYQLSQLDSTRQIDTNFVKNHLSVLTQSDIEEYLSNEHYTKDSFISWLTLKTKLLPLLIVPELADDFETMVHDRRVEALVKYQPDLQSPDKLTRENAKTVFIINLYEGIIKALDPQIDELLKHTLEKYTEQDK